MKNNIDIVFGGDFFPGRGTAKFVAEDPKMIWGDVLPIFKKCDFSTLNLEAPVTNSNYKIIKTGPHLKVPFETLNALKEISLNMVTLANNHIKDYGEIGVLDTIANCEDLGIKTIGAGKNLKESNKPLFVEIKGKKIAFINVSENEWNSATKDSAGSNPFNIISLSKQIYDIKKVTNLILLIVHGGHEHYQLPNPRTVEIYRYLVDIGIKGIISHHTHCYSGFEIYNNVPIFYGLGNLFFPNKTGLKTSKEGFLLKLVINEDDSIKVELFPYIQYTNPQSPSIKLMDKLSAIEFFKNMDILNNIIGSEELLQKHWEEYILSKTEEVMSLFVAPTFFIKRVINRLKLSKYFTNKTIISYRLNQIRCEAHYELTKSVFLKYLNN